VQEGIPHAEKDRFIRFNRHQRVQIDFPVAGAPCGQPRRPKPCRPDEGGRRTSTSDILLHGRVVRSWKLRGKEDVFVVSHYGRINFRSGGNQGTVRDAPRSAGGLPDPRFPSG